MAYVLWTRVRIHRASAMMRPWYSRRSPASSPLTVRIPAHLVIALRDEARRRRLDVSELVADDVSVFREVAESLEQRTPGYLEAWHFPYTLERAAEIAAEATYRKYVRADDPSRLFDPARDAVNHYIFQQQTLPRQPPIR